MHRTQTTAQSGPADSRLVQLLTHLDRKAAKAPHEDFAERLGRLFDLSDAITLDGANKHRPKGPFQASEDAAERLQADLLKTRATLLEHLSRSFAGEKAASVISLPALRDDAPADKRPTFGPYERFYQGHQRQLIAGISNLRLRARRILAGHSESLARLAELDAVFENSLAPYVRQCFGNLAGFLERRYRTLWEQRDPFHTPPDWLQPHGWLSQFQRELQMLLLAELDARQEPVLGLLDALNNEVSTTL
ncbi:MAG: DUF3348 domain-containing protein [Pseudomonadales bacterium]|nr:DUF3348 domain-containing protein [Pseudomonadales bacterium]